MFACRRNEVIKEAKRQYYRGSTANIFETGLLTCVILY